MPPHPSLSANPIRVQPLRPAEDMEPYVPCWCQSGAKFKFCHFRRDEQEKVNFFKLEAQMKVELRKGYCSVAGRATDTCSERIAKSHTVQRRGGLALIAEDQHVLTVQPVMKEMIEAEGKPEPRRIGVGQASVFPGFCGHHDTVLFKPIEGRQVVTDVDTAFLFAYRAIAYERYAKEAQQRIMELLRETDRGQPFWKQVVIQQSAHLQLAGIQIGMHDVELWKAEFDARLASGDRSDFHFVAVRFDAVLPFVAACAFHVEYDMVGNPLQRLGRDGGILEHMSVNVTAYEGETVAVFGWVGAADGPAARLAQSFIDIPDERKADCLLRLMLVQSDNIFMGPHWWDGLNADMKAEFIELIQAGLPSVARSPADYRLPKIPLLVAGVAELSRA